MKWLFTENGGRLFNFGYYQTRHIAVLLTFLVLGTGLFFIFKNKSLQAKLRLLHILTALMVLSKLTVLIVWGFFNTQNLALLTNAGGGQNIALWVSRALPLSLCGFNTYIFPAAFITKKKVWYQYMTTLSMFGALIGFLLPYGKPSVPFLFFDFFFSHFVYVFVPFCMLAFKLYTPSFRYFSKTLGAYMLVLLSAFCLSAVMNYKFNPDFNRSFAVNYIQNGYALREGEFIYSAIWTMFPNGTPLLSTFFKILPVPYLYLYFCAPLMLGLWTLVILPFHIKERRRHPRLFKRIIKQ